MPDKNILNQLSESNKMLDELVKIRKEDDPRYGKGRWVTNDEGLLLQSMVRLFGIKVVVESGTANGFSACYMATANEGIKVHTFDIVSRPKVWKSLPELESRIIFHNERFSKGAKATIDSVVGGNVLVFIDGDHSVGSVREDWEAVIKELHDGDVVVFHDLRERAVGKNWMRIKTEVGETKHRFVELDTKRRMGVVLWNVK